MNLLKSTRFRDMVERTNGVLAAEDTAVIGEQAVQVVTQLTQLPVSILELCMVVTALEMLILQAISSIKTTTDQGGTPSTHTTGTKPIKAHAATGAETCLSNSKSFYWPKSYTQTAGSATTTVAKVRRWLTSCPLEHLLTAATTSLSRLYHPRDDCSRVESTGPFAT